MSTMWPVTWPDSFKPEEQSEFYVLAAEELAVNSLRALTLNRVGIARLQARPKESGAMGTWAQYSTPRERFYPSSENLKAPGWHSGVSGRAKLVAPVAEILSVSVRGQVVDASEYEVIEGAYLVRKDRTAWCQPNEDMVVDYYTGYPANRLASLCAGILAHEFFLGMTESPDKCQLPRGVTEYTRAGVTLTIEAGMFPGGMTNIPEVDAFIRSWNPHGLVTKPTVHSPDIDGAIGTGGRW